MRLSLIPKIARIALVITAIAPPILIRAQVTAPAFEAASVKPPDPAVRYTDLRITSTRLTGVNLTLNDCIREAYGVRYDQVLGGPSWRGETRFNIEATAGREVNREQMMAMWRTLLEDRFKLKARREMRDGTVYVLTLGKGPHKLRPPAKDTDRPMIRMLRNTPNNFPGVSYTGAGQNATLSQLTAYLAGIVQSPVTDETGITGNYDFQFDYRPLNLPPDGPPEIGPSIFDSVQSQLGLKLEARKGQLEFLVIDHAEKPSEN